MVAKRERGAALLTVLMLVAVIAVLAGAALEKLRLSTRTAGNAAVTEQARGFAMAAEAMALTRVTAQLGRSPDKVTLAGGWSGRPFSLPLPGGLATARVTDGGNCFNLNGLVSEISPGVYAKADIPRAQFARLMRLLTVPPQVAEQIAAGATDWIDTDQEPLPQGAEDGAYLSQETPYRTAGTLMADPSELRAVNGVTPDIYAKLRPWLCTLPQARPSVINVNTLLPEQAPLLAMLYPDNLTVGAASQALIRRPPQGYANVGELTNVISQGGKVTDAGSQMGVTTAWFALRIDVGIGGTGVEEHALIDASRLPARLVSRQWGEQS